MQQNGAPWPRVTVVTPSYNQGEYLEATIRSVLLQSYPNLEYIIMDGGSNDNSVEIIRKYESWLAYWVSEPDKGQAHAINKGFARATGDIFAWLNSDDIYASGSLHFVAQYFTTHLDSLLIYGNGWFLDENGQLASQVPFVREFDAKLMYTFDHILQPAAFWRRSLWEQTGELDGAYNWGLDWEWFIRAAAITPPQYVPVDLAFWRLTPTVKSLEPTPRRREELAMISRRYGGVLQPTHLLYQADRLADWMVTHLGRNTFARIPQYPLTAVRLMMRRVFAGRYLT
jgi:glycosyltransferase involved in cell wall biosynthesis